MGRNYQELAGVGWGVPVQNVSFGASLSLLTLNICSLILLAVRTDSPFPRGGERAMCQDDLPQLLFVWISNRHRASG